VAITTAQAGNLPDLTLHEDFDTLIGTAAMPKGLAEKRVTESMDLTGRVAVVTGGGGINMGSACVDRLASLGATVVALDLDGAAAKVAADSASAKWGVTTCSLAADMTDYDAVSRAACMVADWHGQLDIWVNNCGLPMSYGLFQDAKAADFRADIDVNLMSCLYGAHAALQIMLPQGSGRIINFASVAGGIGRPELAAYSAAKGGVIAFTRSLSYDLRGTGVTVAGVSPGVTIGPPLAAAMRNAPPEHLKTIADAMDRITANRVGLAEEVANMVAFLCTEAGAYVVGSTLPVAGGMGE
jgi:3-oxoacyl-[acyl-carrier protein] reductase